MRNNLLLLLLFPLMTFAHSVQVQWCISCEGDLRIWLEHWHGTEDPNTTTMTISVSVNGISTTYTSVPGGGVIDVLPENLPGCTTPLIYETGCPFDENMYNDWVYYDFPDLPANVPISFTIISGNTVFTEDCGGMYPLTVDATIPILDYGDIGVCADQLTAAILMDDNATWTNSNPSIGLAASGTGSIPEFVPIGSVGTTTTAIISYSNNCSVGSFELEVFPQSDVSVAESDYNGYNISCNGAADGEIDLTVMGNGPHTYSWTGPGGFAAFTEDISGLSPGIYEVTVTDNNTCSIIVQDIEITEPPILDISEIHSNYTGYGVSCNGLTDGFINITVTGGTGAYTYAWSNGAITEDISGLAAGIYSVVATDENDCFIDIVVNITEPPILSISEIHSDYTGYGVSCNGLTDGFIDITVTGGTGIYTYAWSNGATTEDVSGLAAGIYSVVATDQNDCSISLGNIDIIEPPVLDISEIHSDYTGYGVSCNGSNDGFIDITVTGGTGIYTYAWSNGSINEDLSGLAAGIYSVVATDQNGCFVDIAVNITEPPVLDISEIHSDYTGYGVSCNGSTDGFIDITVTGGAGMYTYSPWSNGSASEDLSNIGAGIYSISVTDENGCVAFIQVNITEPNVLAVSAIPSDYNGYGVSCSGSSDGVIDIIVTGGAGLYAYDWSNGSVNQDLYNIDTGLYSVLVTDENGCVASTQVNITEPAQLQENHSFNDSGCGFNNGNIDVTISGGVFPYNYSWSNGETTEDIENLSPGVYDLTVTDANGCDLDLSQSIINTPSTPFLFSADLYDCQLTTYLYAFTNDNNPGPWEYLGVYDDVVFDDPFASTTMVTVPQYGVYAFQYSACNTADTLVINFSCPVEIPNVLTTNGDGNNDLFIIENLTPEVYAQSIFTVYNRWGRIVYFNPNYGLDDYWWDGTITYDERPYSSLTPERPYDQNAAQVNDGVYYYSLELFHHVSQIKDHYTGYMHIIK